MSFENEMHYRRKPETVQALRLTADGNIPVTHSGLDWVQRMILARGLSRGEGGWFVGVGTVHVRAVYPGDWLVLHDGTGVPDVVSDERFRALYEGYVPEEEE